MSDHRLAPLVAAEVERNRPTDPPPFDALTARWRRRRRVRRGAVATAVVVAAAVAVPAVFVDRPVVPAPEVSASGGPAGRIPWEVTGVRACRGTDCRTVDDPAQVRLLVEDFNADSQRPLVPPGPCEPDPVGITLTFSGPRGPYPVVRVLVQCSWWGIEGESPQYGDWGRARTSAQQAQRFGVVRRDCEVTSPYLEPDELADEYVGLSAENARSLAAGRGVTVRVLGRDGDCTDFVTDDNKGTGRVNLYLENDRVTSASYY